MGLEDGWGVEGGMGVRGLRKGVCKERVVDGKCLVGLSRKICIYGESNEAMYYQDDKLSFGIKYKNVKTTILIEN